MKRLGQVFIVMTLALMSFTTVAKANSVIFSVDYFMPNDNGINVKVYNNLWGDCIINQTFPPTDRMFTATFVVSDYSGLGVVIPQDYTIVISYEFFGYNYEYQYNLSEVIETPILIVPPYYWVPGGVLFWNSI